MFLTNRSFLLKYHLGYTALTGRLAPSACWGSSKVSNISVSCLHSTDLKEIVSIFTLPHRDIHKKPKFTPYYCLSCALLQMKLSERFLKSEKCCFSGIYISVWTRSEPVKYQSINFNALHRSLWIHGSCWQLFEGWLQGCNLGTKNHLFFLPSPSHPIPKYHSPEVFEHFYWVQQSTAQTAPK